MANYIDRDEAIKVLRKSNNSHAETSRDVCLLERDVRLLKEQPTIDAVEVVRCKDCKHRFEPTRCALWYGECNGNQYFLARGDDFYCANGERSKTDE